MSAEGEGSGLTLPQLISYVLTLVLLVRILGFFSALFRNKYIPLAVGSLGISFCIVKACFWGTPEATHILLTSIGIVFIVGCQDTVLSLRRYGIAYSLASQHESFHVLWQEGRRAQMSPPRPVHGNPPPQQQPPQPGMRTLPKRRK
eukprot:TRINITY_DN3921_c1_g2_i2.p1 TRINITY_DN3921_c1_g2~~TRINITY_DN3921_c1_g2_i2.p1  ORF type:complete len:146 (+),score=41.45 TRINITY_DN3921_c1_g2_i2:809-1246(+)